jgi:glycosyltransferase involved in cell wall biosynthesis
MKIAVLKVKEKSAWRSCQIISQNLVAAYTRMQKSGDAEVEFVGYTKKEMELKGRTIFEKLQRTGVKRVVLIDHFPYPGNLFPIFARIFEELNYYPEIYVHTYGCLMHWFHELDPKSRFYSKCKIHLIAASNAQRGLIAQFLKKETPISVINFPIDSELFKPVKDRKGLRQKLGFSAGDTLLIYTGRAHVQKNLPLLLKSVAPLLKATPSMKFLFAGSYDDGPVNFLEYRYAYGASKAMVSDVLKENGIEKQFIELGNLSHPDLVRYLNAADIFCSLSMYNDEDYGYAPLEALSVGCPAVITAWGGYREFESSVTKFVSVTREHVNKLDSLFVSPTEVQSKIQETLVSRQVDRESTAREIQEWFSIPAIAQQIQDLHANTTARPLAFHPKAFPHLQKARAFPLHRYVYLNLYQSYYR